VKPGIVDTTNCADRTTLRGAGVNQLRDRAVQRFVGAAALRPSLRGHCAGRNFSGGWLKIWHNKKEPAPLPVAAVTTSAVQ
jgi:hypothetical protein